MGTMQYILMARLRRGLLGVGLLLVGLEMLAKGRRLCGEWDIASLGSFHLVFPVRLDAMAEVFFAVVLLIARRVLLFSLGYSRTDLHQTRFTRLVLLFVLSMGVLIHRPSLVGIILGWEGLGVTSFFLVAHYQNRERLAAGMITILFNRVGDVALLVRLAVAVVGGSYLFPVDPSALLVGLLLLAAFTKRAQVPFSPWLPAAMAAPTPVSALVHSSTLVTAGVYLLIRINILVSTTTISAGLILIGTLTTVMAGFTAIFEIDMKKIIALSTLSQLGIIIITLGAKMPLLSFFHLLSHAFFKAILFICAGIVIHNIKDYQNIRKIGNSLIALPLISSVIIIANLRLRGLPFLTGFYSKDLILEIIIISNLSKFIFFLVIVGTFLTIAYSCRLRYLVSLRLIKRESCFMIMEGDKFIITGILILIPFSIFGGINLS